MTKQGSYSSNYVISSNRLELLKKLTPSYFLVRFTSEVFYYYHISPRKQQVLLLHYGFKNKHELFCFVNITSLLYSRSASHLRQGTRKQGRKSKGAQGTDNNFSAQTSTLPYWKHTSKSQVSRGTVFTQNQHLKSSYTLHSPHCCSA